MGIIFNNLRHYLRFCLVKAVRYRYNTRAPNYNHYKTRHTMTATHTPVGIRRQAASLVKRAGVRMTRQRHVVLEVVLSSCDHPTAATIYERCRQHLTGISLATVYNSLEAMTEAGIINHLHFDNGPSRYCANLVPHVHMQDEVNDRVIDVQLKEGLRPEDVFDLPEGARVCRMDACLHGFIPDSVKPA